MHLHSIMTSIDLWRRIAAASAHEEEPSIALQERWKELWETRLQLHLLMNPEPPEGESNIWTHYHARSAGRKHLWAYLPAENASSIIACIQLQMTWKTQLEISWWVNLWRDQLYSHQACGEESTSAPGFEWQWNSEIYNLDTQMHDGKDTGRMRRLLTWKTAGKHSPQLGMISVPSTGQMSSAPTDAPTRQWIGVTANAPERRCDDMVSLIDTEQGQKWLQKEFSKRLKMLSEGSEYCYKWHHEQQSVNHIVIDSPANYWEMITDLRNQDWGQTTPNFD